MENTTPRRTFLAALGSGAVSLSGGCLRRARSLTGWESAEQVQLQIKTLPADSDPYALKLARTIATWFQAAGVDATVLPMSDQELLRQSLLRNEFELFVMRLPARFRNPDALYTLLHSSYADAPGWQNPFGYTNLDVDSTLETQRTTDGSLRRTALDQLQQTLARTQPFTLLTVPDDIRTTRTETFTNWGASDLQSPTGYLQLGRTTEDNDTTLDVAMADSRATTNLNPLSVEFRRNGVLTGLLYDTLAYPADEGVTPWLAKSWGISEDGPPTARVSLRENTTWHDGEPLTAEDVAFTYELLKDTTLDTDGDRSPVPSPRFRSRSSLVDDVRVLDKSTVEFQFVDAEPAVAVRAFTVPILPKHIWSDRTAAASLGGINVGPVTDALVTSNIPPIGSGPLKFVRNTPRESLVLDRFEGHFSTREHDDSVRPLESKKLPYDRVKVHVVSSDLMAVELVAEGMADVTGTAVGAEAVPRIGRTEDAKLLVGRSHRPYILGYNTRRAHLNNPRFRNTLARLIDDEHLSTSVLSGYGRPAVSPLWGTEWLPESLEWVDENPATPFIGDDGELDREAAREAFRTAGYQYDENALVGRLP